MSPRALGDAGPIIPQGLGDCIGPGVVADVPGGRGLLPPPHDVDCYPSFAFPVVHTAADGSLKVRRCEDWKRSKSNELAVATDKPPHHGIDSYVCLARYIFKVFGTAPQT